jgi:Fe2+ or Zn2+ uptake regulation protein
MLDSYTHTLRTAGLKVTKSRMAVLKLLTNAKTPLSVDTLSRRARGVDRVTVYRILESFVASRIARSVDLRRGHMLYELYDEHDHHHLVCTQCGTTEDFTGCDIGALVQRALQRSSFAAVTDHSLELFGTCKQCTALV